MSGLSRRALLSAAGGAAIAVPGIAASRPSTPDDPGHHGHGHGVLPGADVVAARHWRELRGKRVGVVSNPTGVLTDMTHIVDDMVAADVPPVAIFGPEHGFRGTAQAGGSEGKTTDPRTGISVYDAYQVTAGELAAMYREARVDTVVFDIANVGARFYTYTWTMYIAMHAAVLAEATFVVLDRPDPVGGAARGPQLQPAYATFVGMKPIVQQPGMTSGELAKLFDAEFLPADTGGRRLSHLDVVRVRDWRRDRLDDGLAWVPPSPNMPTQDTAMVYPGTCMFEGTVLSEGRGTTRPFEMIGAPGIDWHWTDILNSEGLDGVMFRENYFVPTFSKFTGKNCGGVQVVVTDRHSYDPIRTAVVMLVSARKRYPDVFGWREDDWIDNLTGSDRLRTMIDAGASADEVVGAWSEELERFDDMRQPYLLYR